jgi:hypothetical protein
MAPFHPILPKQYAYDPGAYQPNAPEANPTGSVPGPLAMENRGYWSDTRKVFQWSARGAVILPAVVRFPYGDPAGGSGPTVGDPLFRGLWQTPPFDLRPDLRSSASADQTLAYPIYRGGAYGAGAVLSVLLENLRTIAGGVVPALEFYTLEFAHPLDPVGHLGAFGEGLAPLGTRQNITSQVWAASTGNALLTFNPPANPVRYWAVAIILDIVAIPGEPVPVPPAHLTAWGVLQ